MAGVRVFASYGTSRIFLVLIISCLVLGVWTYQRTVVSHCVPIQEPICKGNYISTSFPNILGHEDHEEASARLREFTPLIKNSCSQHIKFFLCSLHFPMCDAKVPYGIPACREMCDDVRIDCEPYLKAFHLEWPETIQCSKLPPASSYRCLVPRSMALSHQERNEEISRNREESPQYDDILSRLAPRGRGHRKRTNRKQNRRKKERTSNPPSTEIRPEPPTRDLIDEPKQIVETVVPTSTIQLPNTPKPSTATTKSPPNTSKSPPDSSISPPATSKQTSNPSTQLPETPETTLPNNHRWSPVSIDNGLSLDEDPIRRRDYYYDDNYNQFVPTEGAKPKCKNDEKFTFVKNLNACLPKCDANVDVMFSSHDKNFIYYWMMACSILCFVSSALTVGTFLVDSKRFRYPERPIIFLSLCYLLYATAYLVRLGRGPTGSVSCVTTEESDVHHLVMGDLESTGCTAVFFLLYYFGMAAAAWWVVLSVTWFLAAGLKWGHEAIESNGFCFHLAAWLLPAVQTIVVLVLGKVDGDELTGLCYVGNLNKSSLLYFIIIPLTTYLAIGALALGAGFCALLKIRRVMRKTGDDPVRLEKLILKIGIFTLLYIVPTSCVVAVNIYEYNNLNHWASRAEARPCYPPGFLSFESDSLQYKPYYTQRYSDYNYDDTYMPQSPDYRFAYRNYDDRIYPDIHQTGYSDQAQEYDQRRQGSQYRRSRLRYRQYRPLNNRRYRPGDETNRKRHPQRSVRSSEQRIPFDPKFTDWFTDENSNDRPMSDRDCHLAESIPSFPIYAIKILMSLLAGITSGIWVWSGKTYKSWKVFCKSPWCGRLKSSKGNDFAAHTPQATSSGNLNVAPSITSQLLPKSQSRLGPDGEYPCDNRLSFPLQSPDLFYEYHPENQEDDDVTRRMASSKIVATRKTSALTLGDIAREYSDNLDSEMMHSPRTFFAPSARLDDVTRDDISFYKNSENFKGSKKIRKNRAPSSASNSRFKRAIPNNYVDSRVGRFHREPTTYVEHPFEAQIPPNERRRVRKYSESDVNQLNLVSQSGFEPITSSTRIKAESAHVRCAQRI